MRMTLAVVLSLTAIARRGEPQEATPEAERAGTERAPGPIRVLKDPLRHLVLLSLGRVAARPVGGPSERSRLPDRRLLPREGGYPGRLTAGPPSGRTATARRGPSPFRPYRRTIGENGDLFLAVPFLAPVGPISGAFFGY